jgi:polysaccharide deacetylase 2 family uncharacterized protein YibQ
MLARRPWLVLPAALAVGIILGLAISAFFLPHRSTLNIARLPLLPAQQEATPQQAELAPPHREVPQSTPPAAPSMSSRSEPGMNAAAPKSEPSSERPVSPSVPSQPEIAALPPPWQAHPPQSNSVSPVAPPATIHPPSAHDLPAWRRYAVAVPPAAGKPMIAIVIDDMGLDRHRSAAAVALPGPLTLSFLPYARDLASQTVAARRQGHELMVHIPMQPIGTANPGPNALMTDLPPAEIKRRLDQDLDAFSGYVGINNHMGSRFTTDRAGLDVVMAELSARGLLFLDSRTVPHSQAASVAAAYQVPTAGRNVFLDNEQTSAEVTHQLAETERIARHAGFAIAIGHPHDVTIAALKAWLPTLAQKGFVLVPVSAVVARLQTPRPSQPASAAHNTATPPEP